MAAILRVGSVGVDIIVPLTDSGGNPIDLSTASAMTLFLQQPNATTSVSKIASKLGSGTEGKLIYTTVAGDLPVPGDWKIQARVQYTTPLRDWFSEIYPLIVAQNLGPATTGTFREAPSHDQSQKIHRPA